MSTKKNSTSKKNSLTPTQKRVINKAVKKAVKQYHKTFKELAKT